jgi:hypothetical protein
MVLISFLHVLLFGRTVPESRAKEDYRLKLPSEETNQSIKKQRQGSAAADQMASAYWKTKVLPGLSKIFDKDGKKAAAAEFLKSFDKEALGKEVEDKKAELEPKVAEAYEASPPEVKVIRK